LRNVQWNSGLYLCLSIAYRTATANCSTPFLKSRIRGPFTRLFARLNAHDDSIFDSEQFLHLLAIANNSLPNCNCRWKQLQQSSLSDISQRQLRAGYNCPQCRGNFRLGLLTVDLENIGALRNQTATEAVSRKHSKEFGLVCGSIVDLGDRVHSETPKPTNPNHRLRQPPSNCPARSAEIAF
jgi:hypothetical protein